LSIAVVKVHDNIIELGADSIVVKGDTLNTRDSDAKIKSVERGFSFASAGSAMEIEMFYLFSKTRKPSGNDEENILTFFEEFREWLCKKTDISKINNSFLIVFRGKAFYFHKYYLKEVKDFEAIGAGSDFALAALYLGKSTKEAVQVACDLSIYCEKPINIITESKDG
jgi:ATP-dependent protease HslVU (ClpYQ) peptidase subunit